MDKFFYKKNALIIGVWVFANFLFYYILVHSPHLLLQNELTLKEKLLKQLSELTYVRKFETKSWLKRLKNYNNENECFTKLLILSEKNKLINFSIFPNQKRYKTIFRLSASGRFPQIKNFITQLFSLPYGIFIRQFNLQSIHSLLKITLRLEVYHF